MSSDYGQIGSSLRQREVQYTANRDDYGIWRILDTWHKEMSAMTLTDELDIPDDSDAVLVIKEGQFLALMREVEQQDYMPEDKAENNLFEIASEGNEPSTSTSSSIDQELEIQALRDERDTLLEIVSTLRGQQNAISTNTFKHERAMKVLESIETMSNKGNLDIDIATLLKTIIAD
jgi:chorismate mutase|tara:strand:- start:2957 stop:3484 length:528 start_codon:yes stop_codon:yes gene_type:complete